MFSERALGCIELAEFFLDAFVLVVGLEEFVIRFFGFGRVLSRGLVVVLFLIGGYFGGGCCKEGREYCSDCVSVCDGR